MYLLDKHCYKWIINSSVIIIMYWFSWVKISGKHATSCSRLENHLFHSHIHQPKPDSITTYTHNKWMNGLLDE